MEMEQRGETSGVGDLQKNTSEELEVKVHYRVRSEGGLRRGIDGRRHIAEESYATVMDAAPNYVSSGTLRGTCL